MLVGSLDQVDRSRVRGWVRDPAFPAAPVSLVITADGELVDRVVANRLRPDVERAGHGRGRHGFEVAINPPLSPARPWLIHVRAEADGADMPGSPHRLEASDRFDATAQKAFSAALGAFHTAAELEGRVRFLSEERDRLAQLRLGRRSGRPGTAERRALVIDDRVPDPARNAGGGAVLSHMRSLQRLGFVVSFVCPAMDGGAEAAQLESAGIECCQAPWFTCIEDVMRREPNAYDLVYLHRAPIAAAYGPLVRRYQARARVVFAVADLHHVRMARQSEVEGRPELMDGAKWMRAQEIWAARSADAVITHSSFEAALLQPLLGGLPVHVIRWSVPVRPVATPFAARSGVVFIGDYAHAPNVDAAFRLRDRIMPIVQQTDPAIVCRIVGANLPASLREPRPGYAPVGHAADLQAVFEQARLTVAPMAYGAGVKGKVLDSLAAGLPCACTPIAAEGLDLPVRLRRLVAAEPEEIARVIVQLHDDEVRNQAISRLGLGYAAKALSEKLLDRQMHKAAIAA